jgi:hypothetical protein
MKIFLGGSRHLEYIPNEVIDLLNSWISDSHEFLIGDASGSDTAFQQFLAKRGYSNVTIYSSAGAIRNNLGNWQFEIVDSGLRSKSHAIHAFKDREMSKKTDFGLMIWDCESAGTLSNVIDLVSNGKECFAWIAPESELCKFDSINGLNGYLKSYPEVAVEARKRLETFKKRELKRQLNEINETLF